MPDYKVLRCPNCKSVNIATLTEGEDAALVFRKDNRNRTLPVSVRVCLGCRMVFFFTPEHGQTGYSMTDLGLAESSEAE